MQSFQTRRATIDDLPQLIALWKVENLPWRDLERQITEFQVAVDAQGRIAGAIGIQMTAKQGRIHSESFLQAELADDLRAIFLERIRTLSQNHSLYNLWTRESAPFWRHHGFQTPSPEQMEKLPPAFKDDNPAWLMLQMQAEPPPIDLDKEFGIFREYERARTEETLRKARLLNSIATLLAVFLFVGVVCGMAYLMWRRNR